MKKTLCLAAVFLLLFARPALGEENVGILYKVTGGNNTLYLLGSIHIGTEDMYPFGKNVLDALDSSGKILYECDTVSPVSLLLLQTMCRYPAGDSLRLHLSNEAWAMTERFAKSRGLSVRSLESYRPWALVNSFLPATTAFLLGKESSQEVLALGVENSIRTLAGEKPEGYLEETREQADALNSLSDDVQEMLLTEMIALLLGEAEPSGSDADLPLWPVWWKEGNAQAFAGSFLSSGEEKAESTEEYRRILLTERNERMTERLAAVMEAEGPADAPHTIFAVVGLMHLVLPEDSIPLRLEKMGYTVEQVK